LHSLTRVLHLECNILDQESPDLIAEPIGIEMSLCLVSPRPSPPNLKICMYFERQPRLHLVGQYLCDTAIKVRQDLHRELRFDAPLTDQVIEGVRERHADARIRQ
jgi:hypothetical protein